MHSFTEWYRVMWFARNIADGDFSYLWYGQRYTMYIGWEGVRRIFISPSYYPEYTPLSQ